MHARRVDRRHSFMRRKEKKSLYGKTKLVLSCACVVLLKTEKPHPFFSTIFLTSVSCYFLFLLVENREVWLSLVPVSCGEWFDKRGYRDCRITRPRGRICFGDGKASAAQAGFCDGVASAG